MKWTIKITSKTHDPAGKRRSWTRTLKPPFTTKAKHYIEENLPPLFYGCNVDIITPLHHNCGHVDPDTHKFVYDMGPNG